MKRLFAVTSANIKKPHAFFEKKTKAKQHRDQLIAAGNGTAHVTLGPDHRRFKK